MHREIRNHIEDVLGGAKSAAGQQHLAECAGCRAKVEMMREQASLLRELRPPEGVTVEPRAGFYARVMERIESEGPLSIWNLFIESAFGRRIAVASMALALLVGIYLVTAERAEDESVVAVQQEQVVTPDVPLPASLVVAEEDAPGRVIMQMGQKVAEPADSQSADDAILVNLVTYEDQ